MPVSDVLLKILVCPESHQSLRNASSELLASLNLEVEKGTLRCRGGESVSSPLSAAVVREDGKVVFRVVDGECDLRVEFSIEVP